MRRELQAKMLLTERRIERRLAVTRETLGTTKGLGNMEKGSADGSVFSRANAGDIDDKAAVMADDAALQAAAAMDVEADGPDAIRPIGLPRLEVLAERLQLDAFEKRMILLLIGAYA